MMGQLFKDPFVPGLVLVPYLRSELIGQARAALDKSESYSRSANKCSYGTFV